MTSSPSATLVENAPALSNTPARSEDQDVPLSLPEATMFIVGTSGMLWMLLYGTFNTLIG